MTYRTSLLGLWSVVAAVTTLPVLAHADPQAAVARAAILGLDLAAAETLLSVDRDDPEVLVERGRLALYRGECDAAVAVLRRPEVDEDAAEHLLGVALGCARGTAGTVVLGDEAGGVVVRFQDDEDQALFPLIARTVGKVRDNLEADLGTRLPSPVFIDLVRDQFSLAALSGLPEKAAKTTGTVAVAKWGRVMQLSPRAAGRGYPWLDTLAHEMTHLVLSQATRDRAPLWLQEGVAKRQETRWREADPFDDTPSADAVAAIGMERGLGRRLTELGPSIAMLPSAAEASVAFAQVASFIGYYAEHAGDRALPKLLAATRDALPDTDMNEVVRDASGKSLDEWDELWRAHLAARSYELPAAMAPGGHVPDAATAARKRRLGVLLSGRGHFDAAASQLSEAHRLLPGSAMLRCHLAEALMSQGDRDNAVPLVERLEDLDGTTGRWWSLHRLLVGPEADPRALDRSLALDPLDPAVACQELDAPALPGTLEHAMLCQAARRIPRGR